MNPNHKQIVDNLIRLLTNETAPLTIDPNKIINMSDGYAGYRLKGEDSWAHIAILPNKIIFQIETPSITLYLTKDLITNTIKGGEV